MLLDATFFSSSLFLSLSLSFFLPTVCLRSPISHPYTHPHIHTYIRPNKLEHMASEQLQSEPRTILVAVDESDAARAALTYALRTMYRQGDKLLLLSCYRPLEDYGLPEGKSGEG